MASRRQGQSYADVAASPAKSETPSKSDVTPAVPAYVSYPARREYQGEEERLR